MLSHPDARLTNGTAEVIVIRAVRPNDEARFEIQPFTSVPATSAFLRNEQFRI